MYKLIIKKGELEIELKFKDYEAALALHNAALESDDTSDLMIIWRKEDA